MRARSRTPLNHTGRSRVQILSATTAARALLGMRTVLGLCLALLGVIPTWLHSMLPSAKHATRDSREVLQCAARV